MAYRSNPRASDRLVALAKTPERKQALAGRMERYKSRTRQVTCTACGETKFDNRDPLDICEACLTDLWSAQAILQGEYDARKKGGLITAYFPRSFYRLEYPGLSVHGGYPPKDAPFARMDDRRTHDSTRTLQLLFNEIGEALAGSYPADPQSRDSAVPVIPHDSGDPKWGDPADYYMFSVPPATVKALRDLWYFFRWHSHEAFRQGFDKGNNLLMRMNMGETTHQMFLEEIADQAKEFRRDTDQVLKGAISADERYEPDED